MEVNKNITSKHGSLVKYFIHFGNISIKMDTFWCKDCQNVCQTASVLNFDFLKLSVEGYLDTPYSNYLEYEIQKTKILGMLAIEATLNQL